MLKNQNAQALLELAVLGSLIIMAFAIVIGSSENYNRQQSYMQQTFRATLFKARDANDTGSVQTVDFRRMPNVTNPVEIGTLAQFSSGNSVLWSDGKKKGGVLTESKQYFLHNRVDYQLIAAGPPGVIPGSTVVTSSGYGSNLNADSTFDKTEQSGSIGTKKTLDATDAVGGWADVGTTVVTTGGLLGSGGRYGSDPILSRRTKNTKEN